MYKTAVALLLLLLLLLYHHHLCSRPHACLFPIHTNAPDLASPDKALKGGKEKWDGLL